jgi:small GTP-binding protein
MSSNEVKIDFDYEILPDDHIEYDLSFKIIVIGDSGVGKSCLSTKATRNKFENDHCPTVGFEFFTFNIKIENKVIKLQIWDTCGQELYRSLITNFYRNSSLAIIVYAINSRESFKNIDMWLKELRTNSSPDTKVILIGNKIDLEDERQIKTEEGKLFAKENNLTNFMESSAKSGFNCQNIFIYIAKLLRDDFLMYNKNNDEEDINSSASSVQSQSVKQDQNQKLDPKMSRSKGKEKSKKLLKKIFQ